MFFFFFVKVNLGSKVYEYNLKYLNKLAISYVLNLSSVLVQAKYHGFQNKLFLRTGRSSLSFVGLDGMK